MALLPDRVTARAMALYGGFGIAGYLVLWVTVALAYEQNPLDLRPRDTYPFLSGAAVFAAAGLLLGSIRASGRTRISTGALAGAGTGYLAALWLLVHPYALPVLIPAVAIVGAAALAGGLIGGLAELPRRRRRAIGTRP